ncbi:MAG: OmpA family protein [Candidatus Sulfopaludibacter sp.]|nr:OmpA family protein [Candidatus Sulfopaludibacter sp.]
MVCAALSAQDQPFYRVTVTSRTAKAISYQHRSGATSVDFQGTDLLPSGRGKARVESKQGRIAIEVEFDGLQPATKNGAEYLTYVLWAITPEGRTANLGEVLLNGTKSKLDVTTELQVFGLIVTAEPYYAVSQPSDLVVMENVVRADTVGKVEPIDAKYELLQRGQYDRLANPLALKLDRKQPLELYEARNAVQIARAMGADQFAPETFQKAEKSLSQAETYQSDKAGRKPVTMAAREAVQMAEDSRVIAVKRQEETAVNRAQEQSLQRETSAENGRAAAESETDRVRRDAEAARLQAEAETGRLTRENHAQAAASQADLNRVKQENDGRMAAAASEAERLKTLNDARETAAGAEADRLKMQNEARETAAGAEADRLKIQNDNRETAAGAEADRLKRENDLQRASSQVELDSATRQAAQLQAEKAELRVNLLAQFNAILQTRDTERGLIVNMSDVLFDTGKYSLRPVAREKLAKLAGIVSGHPGLLLAVEGYTDSVGGDDYNQQLSEDRSESVRDYLTRQGMAVGSVTAKGFGKTHPVATNETADGRQQNRRVELVISGEVIGTVIGTPITVR